MARDVGEGGKVYAVDIQREMLHKLRQRSSKYKLNNIEPVLGKVDDPNLPANQIDLVLMVDVYHEFSHPESMLWGIRRSLKPKGVVALLEYREEDPNVPIKPLHNMSKRQIMKEYTAKGIKLEREFNELPWQHLMFFARDDSPLEKMNGAAQQILRSGVNRRLKSIRDMALPILARTNLRSWREIFWRICTRKAKIERRNTINVHKVASASRCFSGSLSGIWVCRDVWLHE